MKLILDRMLGKMKVWLRLCGYDTLYVGEMDIREDEDEFLLMHHRDRVLVTRDKELYLKSLKIGRDAIFIESNDVEAQMMELKKKAGIVLEPSMERCSLCNSLLRKPAIEEIERVIEKEDFPEKIKNYDLYYCHKCEKLYWVGSHWTNISEFVSRLNSG